jgi:putative transposase
LPHWDVDDGIYFVTSCLEGSIPAQGRLDLFRYRDELEVRPKPAQLAEDEWEIQKSKLVFARFDGWIYRSPAVKWLENPEVAQIVRDAFLHFAGTRYDLIAYVVMPSHFHWVFHPRVEWFETNQKEGDRRSSRECIMQSVKGFTARRCNQVLGLAGPFWQDESWDHVVRGDVELEKIVRYVEENPAKAKLINFPEDWRSSARDRRDRSIEPGQYLLR